MLLAFALPCPVLSTPVIHGQAPPPFVRKQSQNQPLRRLYPSISDHNHSDIDFYFLRLIARALFPVLKGMPDISTDCQPTSRKSLFLQLDTTQASSLCSLSQSAILRLFERTCNLTILLDEHFDITQTYFVIPHFLAAIQIPPYACVVFTSLNRESIIYLDCG